MLENSRLSILFFTRKHENQSDALKVYARVTKDFAGIHEETFQPGKGKFLVHWSGCWIFNK